MADRDVIVLNELEKLAEIKRIISNYRPSETSTTELIDALKGAIDNDQRITEAARTVNGVTVKTFIKDIADFNILTVEVGTTGYKGGDSSHGGRTFFSVQDSGGTDIEVRRTENGHDACGGFEVELGGDAELSTITQALEFILTVLKTQKD